MTWEEAIVQVLNEEGSPMSSKEITNKILEKGYREADRPIEDQRKTVGGLLSKNEKGWFEHELEEGKCKGKYKLKKIPATDKIVASTAAKVDLSVSLYDLVRACIETIGRKCFEAKELYAFAPIFKVCMPQCENLEDALKHQLDELVKEGLLDALPSDCYSVK